MSRRNVCAALALGLALTGPAALAATHAKRELSPKALYQALLKPPAIALPAGYQGVRIGPIPASPIAKRHHVVGEVAIGAAKTDTAGARVLYIVFPTHADALADWKEGSQKLPGDRLTPPSFVPKPAAMFNVPATVKDSTGKPVTYGTTTLAYVTGNTIVEIDTSSTLSAVRGDIVGGIALAQFAFTRLASILGPATPVAPAKTAAPVAPIA